MIIDKSNGRLAEIKAFAKEHDLMGNFKDTFSRFVFTVLHFRAFAYEVRGSTSEQRKRLN